MIYYEISAHQSASCDHRLEPISEWYAGNTSPAVLETYVQSEQDKEGRVASLTKWDVQPVGKKKLFLELDEMLYVGTVAPGVGVSTRSVCEVFEAESRGWCTMQEVKT